MAPQSTMKPTPRASGFHLAIGAAVVALALVGSACTSSGAKGSAEGKSEKGSTSTSAPAGASGAKAEPTKSQTGKAQTGKAQTGKALARYADFTSETYEKKESWLCRPDTKDICDSDQDATAIDANGTMTVQPWKENPDAPIDCFYVYPTISADPGEFSDMDVSGGEEAQVALNQVARLGSECRVFAPIYRQRTLAGLAGVLGAPKPSEPTTTLAGAPGPTTPFDDVVEAFKSYMARDNKGRGVVLIGHSQGAGLLKKLLQSEFDPNPDVQAVLVSAYLAGTSVLVPPDAAVGGDLKKVAICTSPEEAGCVVTWSTYREKSPPPPNGLFGRPGADGMISACVNPAKVGAASGLQGDWAEAHSYFGSGVDPSNLSGQTPRPATETSNAWVNPSSGAITTPFVTTPGLLSIRCSDHDGFHYLELRNNPEPGPRVDDVGGDLSPQWGMHLQDVNIVMGDIVNLVRTQTETFQKRR